MTKVEPAPAGRTLLNINGRTLSYNGRCCRLLDGHPGWYLERWMGDTKYALLTYAANGNIVDAVFSDIERFMGASLEDYQIGPSIDGAVC